MIFESHAHYDDAKFDDDREAILSGLTTQGIEYVMNIGSSVEACHKTVELANRYDFIYAALGLHPEELQNVTEEDYEWIVSQIQNHPKVKAVGEIGLDYYWDSVPREVQKEWFERQIELARKEKLPMVIHSRDAAADTYDMMSALSCKDIGGVVHCFSYSVEEARKYLEMGMYIGVGGVVTFKNGKKMKEVVEYTPMEYILIETDSPYLAPEPNRGHRNSSLNLPYIAQAIAQIKKISYDEVVEITNQNARRMYRI